MTGDDKKSGPGETVTRKDDHVGEPGSSGGEHQTPEQAAAVGNDAGGGLSDGERRRDWGGAEPGRPPVAVGGASGGHSDQKDARAPQGDRVQEDRSASDSNGTGSQS